MTDTASPFTGAPFTAEQVAYLERMVTDPGLRFAAPRAAIPATGRVPDVVDGQLIETAWGNAIRDRTLPRYADVASLNLDTVSPVALVAGGPNGSWLLCSRQSSDSKWRAQYSGRMDVVHDANGTIQAAPPAPFVAVLNIVGTPMNDTAFGTVWPASATAIRFRAYKMPASTGGTPTQWTGGLAWQIVIAGTLS